MPPTMATRTVSSISGSWIWWTVDINAKTWEGETALFLATKNLPFTTQAVHTLLKLRANVNIATNEACSALQYAAVKNDPTVTRCVKS